ncbi:CPBP family archaeomyxosortase MrtA [Thermococcus thioreducens]|uniref:CAAX protease n=1 Tax=Thermococcus thioreducens TaxID=277988 RepID=A0A0Q2MTL1_9EURY|nr:CPBP family archaeomyxosortase MrtA [Thermococcus thioreducens]ASJ12372.1 CAAX protease [Thermococcus thioreducens]KQH83103.1 CAAX protease [Thermococcus thioreducens]SEV91979.1 CAAX protease self-immunity [Thermococcus thioreducens]
MSVRRNPWVLYIALLPFILLVRSTGGGIFQWAGYNLLFYFASPLLLASLLGFKPAELGVKVGKKEGYELALILFLLTIPLSLYGTTVPSMKEYYPIFEYSGWGDFLLKELAIGVIMFSHEAFYRGFMLFPLARKNEWLGILAQDIPYTLVHIGKPGIEVPYSFVAGIVFAKIDLKSGSFLPSFLLHWFGSLLFDILCVLL